MPDSSIKYQVSSIPKPRVALVHDWLYGGGAEKVVLELHKMYPDAPIYTSYCSDEWRKRLDGKVVTGYLQLWPFSGLRKFLPLLRQRWFRRLDLSEFDLVISSSGNGEAKFATAPNGKHISYCHTPVHFYWRHYDEYIKNPGFRPKWLVRLGLRLFVRPLRKRDYAAAQAVDHFIANSSQIQKDIKEFYNRDSVVIFPPVEVERFMKARQSKNRSGFVTLGRQVPMKRFDLVIQACTNLNLPLAIIGSGPEHARLKTLAGPNVRFLEGMSDDEVAQELINAQAFLFASFEDFGIAPVEALAAGTPALAYKAGGALDYVVPGKTGEFFEEQTVESLVAVLQKFDPKKYKTKSIQNHAQQFSAVNFQAKLREFLKSNI